MNNHFPWITTFEKWNAYQTLKDLAGEKSGANTLKSTKKYPSFFSPNVSASPAIALSSMTVSAPKATTRAGSGQKFLSFGSVFRVLLSLVRASLSWWAKWLTMGTFVVSEKPWTATPI